MIKEVVSLKGRIKEEFCKRGVLYSYLLPPATVIFSLVSVCLRAGRGIPGPMSFPGGMGMSKG